MSAFKDLRSQRFGRLTAVCSNRKSKKGEHRVWLCRCDCGNLIRTISSSLILGKTQSCGCIRKQIPNSLKHGDAIHGERVRIYKTWIGMKSRCYDKNERSYKSYGGRNIIVCDEWLNNYPTFKEWALSNGYRDNLTIDRINNNGNHEASNCQWLTRSENTKKGNIERKLMTG